MVLPTGTATSWRLIEEESSEGYTYVYDGPVTSIQGRDYLAEQLRQDGASSSLGEALSMAEEAILNWGWIYTDEDTDKEEVSIEDPDIDEARSVLVAKVPLND